MKNRGQIFLILSVIIIVVFLLLRGSVNLPDIIQRQKDTESRFEKRFFSNTVDEFQKVVEISSKYDNISTNVFDFANFTRQRMSERLNDLDFLFVAALSQRTGTTLNISAINLMNKPMNLTLTLNSTPSQSLNMDNFLDRTMRENTFTIAQGNDYTVTISYNSTYNENMTFITRNGFKYYNAFFDITLRSRDTSYKDKFQRTYRLIS